MPYDLHVVRTSNWLEAAKNPITREEVNRLIESDPELEWSASDYVEMKQEEVTNRFYMITWNGMSCFWWYEDQVTCATPDDVQVEKLIDIAEKLSAKVVGDDGEHYNLSRSLFGNRRIKIVQP
jgi:hypothetical protein